MKIEGVGTGAVLMRCPPALLGGADPGPLLRDIAEELAEDAKSIALERKLDAAIARLACHGRPTVLKLDAAALERMFGRRQVIGIVSRETRPAILIAFSEPPSEAAWLENAHPP